MWLVGWVVGCVALIPIAKLRSLIACLLFVHGGAGGGQIVWWGGVGWWCLLLCDDDDNDDDDDDDADAPLTSDGRAPCAAGT